MRLFGWAAVGSAAMALMSALTGPSYALPSLARDSKVSCASCHYKNSTNLLVLEPVSSKKKDILSSKSKIQAGIKFYADTSKPSRVKIPNGQVELGSGLDSANPAGVSGYVGIDLFQASVGWTGPGNDSPASGQAALRNDVWYRLAVTPNAMGLDFTFGVFGSGGVKPAKESSSAWPAQAGSHLPFAFRNASLGVDAGVSANLGEYSVDLQTMYIPGKGIEKQEGDIPTLSQEKDTFGAKAQLGIGGDFGLTASYFSAYKPSDGGAPEKTASIGAWLKIKNNIRIMPEYTIYGPDRGLATKGGGEFQLRFFTGF